MSCAHQTEGRTLAGMLAEVAAHREAARAGTFDTARWTRQAALIREALAANYAAHLADCEGLVPIPPCDGGQIP